MAEGGKEDESGNPFSFKSFVSKKDKRKDDNLRNKDDDSLDIFDSSDNASQRKRDKSRQILLVEDDVKEQPKKKDKSENPFSFKKFLSSGATSVKPSTNKRDASDKAGTKVLPNIATDLPDFVQDHFCDSVGASSRGLELPDFTLDQPQSVTKEAISRGSRTSSLNASSNPDNTQPGLSDSDNDFGDEDHHVHVQSQKTSGIIQKLPDFLSDGAYSGNQSSPPGLSDAFKSPGSPFSDRDTESELHRLQQENQDLRRQVDEARQRRVTDSESITDLQHQIVELKKKEAEETAAMEKAIQQVEQNLTTTTKRAVQAETTVTKLKQEVKSLQAEVKLLRTENDLLRSGDKGLSDIKERTTYVAEQLSAATKTAESSLKQLLSGVDNLKLLSQVLTSIDKISEDKNHDQQDNHKKTFDDP